MAELTAASPEQAPEHDQDSHARLADLKASATKEYSLKNYVAAADFYSEATELQAEINGEMNPDNADLLYAYGRCLYQVAVSKSDVLGGKVAGGEQEPVKKKRKTKSTTTTTAATTASDAMKPAAQKLAEDVVEAAVEEKDGLKSASAAPANKPFFQITGDENWTDSEDSDDDAEDVEDGPADEEEDEEDDDFAIAYEILDVARVLLTRKLESLSQPHDGKGKAKESPPQDTSEGRHIIERLADTHDLQAEISLENERFEDAVADSRSALDLKLKVYPQESSLIAEAHYKLSLALEFASVTQNHEGTENEDSSNTAMLAPPPPQQQQIDEEMRKESVTHMEAAIDSCKLRVKKEEQSLSSLAPDQAKERQKSIKDVKEMIGDMEQRLIDLRNPSVSINSAQLNGPTGAATDPNPLGGILGSIFGESPDVQQARLEDAKKNATDLSSLVRKKVKVPVAASAAGTKPVKVDNGGGPAAASGTAGKRKADAGPADDATQAAGTQREEKKVKFAEDGGPESTA